MMPDDVAACHDGERADVRTMRGSKSPWMSHWKQESCKSETPACSRLSLRVGCKLKEVKEHSDAEKRDGIGGSEVAVDSSVRAGAVGGEGSRAARVCLNNGKDTGKLKKSSFGSNSYPVLNQRKLDGGLSMQREQNGVRRVDDGKCETEACSGDGNVSLNGGRNRFPSTAAAHGSPKTENLARECQVLSREVLPPALLMKSPYAVEPKKLAASTSKWDGFVKSASEMVPKRRDKGKMLMPQLTRGRGPYEVYQSSYNLASEEQITSTKYHSYSSLVIHEKKMSSMAEPRRSSFTRLAQGGIAHFPHDPIADSDDGLYFVRGQRRKTQIYTANPNIADQTAFFESTKPHNFWGDTSLVAQVPYSVHDVETMKIYTDIDSVEESSRGHPKISQTTHHRLMSKITDVNLSDRGQFFRDSAAPTKFRGNTFNRIIDFPSPMSNHALKVLNLETQGSSRKTEGKANVQDFKCPTNLKNESSAETDTMDISALHENNLPGDVPLQTNKCFKDSQNLLTSQAAVTSARGKTIAKPVNTTLLDINKEPHELLTHASSVVERETSTSRTHSLDVEQLLSHADENGKSKSGSSSLGPDPSSRWVKRLKLCTLGSAHGSKSEQIGETSSHEKVNNISSKTSSDNQAVCLAEGQMPDPPAIEFTNDKPSLTEAKKTVEITLSHPWIQRWSHNRASSSLKSLELLEFREPKSSNTMLEKFQKKQFPSIAAMALMGKAMNGLNTSELTKKGPIVVWNTKGF